MLDFVPRPLSVETARSEEFRNRATRDGLRPAGADLLITYAKGEENPEEGLR
jgi:hypothetical protein